MQHNANALWQRYQAAKAQAGVKYARDIAAEMGISEAELTAARVGHDAVRLQDDIRAIIAGLEASARPNASAVMNMRCMSRWASLPTST
jgi:putative hemin transport protein